MNIIHLSNRGKIPNSKPAQNKCYWVCRTGHIVSWTKRTQKVGRKSLKKHSSWGTCTFHPSFPCHWRQLCSERLWTFQKNKSVEQYTCKKNQKRYLRSKRCLIRLLIKYHYSEKFHWRSFLIDFLLIFHLIYH